MLDRRAIGILIATFAFLFVYQYYLLPLWYPPKPPVSRRPVPPNAGNVTAMPGTGLSEKPEEAKPETGVGEPPTGQAKPEATTSGPPEPEKGQETQPEPLPEIEEEPEVPVKDDLVLELPAGKDAKGASKNKLRATFTNRGAALTQLELLDFHTSAVIRKPLPILLEVQKGLYSLVLKDRDGKLDLHRRTYQWDEDRLAMSPPEMSFVARYPRQQIEVRKTFQLEEGKWHLKLRLEIANTGTSPAELNLEFDAGAGIAPEAPLCLPYSPSLAPPDNLYTFAFVGQRKQNGSVFVEQRNFDKIWKAETKTAQPISFDQFPTVFVGGMNRYFAVALIPDPNSAEWTRSAALRAVGNNNIMACLLSAKLEIKPREAATYHFTVFAGPKSHTALETYPDLKAIFSFGWFDSIANLLLQLLMFFHFFTQYLGKIAGGYGLAIICLTLLVRALLHPLSRKAQVSMHMMSKLNPEIQKLREKYGEDKQRLNQEVMKLYKEHNVNPAGGCLPMLLQLPVFIALYRVLQSSISLRGEPFLWMADLSEPDALICFGRGFLGLTSFNVLPLLMVGLWVYQQKLTPKSDDPQQAQMQKMMMFMPIIFGFMFYGMPSGLVLYFVASSSVGLLESKVIKQALAAKDNQAKKSEGKPTGRIIPRTKKKRDRFGR
jgi:YidC/Oxa1 family membrane protein insertase